MKNDFNLDDELEKSIANIVEEETADAQVYVKEKLIKGDDDMPEIAQPKNRNGNVGRINKEAEQDADTFDDDSDDEHLGTKKIIMIVAIIVVSIAIIATIAVFMVKNMVNKSKDNYAYYNNMGYKAYDQKDYDEAIANFEKALTFPEGKSDDKDNIDMMLWLYEAYKSVDNQDKQIDTLERVITIDNDNYNAIYNLTSIYESQEKYSKIYDLYTTVKDSDDESLTAIFNKYVVKEPFASPDAGNYTDDQKIFLSASGDCKIYYTTDGSDPKSNASIFTDKIEVKEGQTTIRFYAVNEYGFESEVIDAVYDIKYGNPDAPTFSPSDSSIEQNSKVMVTLGNIGSSSVAYYTIDGSEPTSSSTIYAGPFELPSGKTTVKVLVVDSHGKSVTASKTYSVKYIPKHTAADAQDSIWNALIKQGWIDKEHNNKDELKCTMKEYGQKVIDGKTIQLFYYYIDKEEQDYFFGADINSDTCDVYKITGEDDEYKLTRI